MIRTVRIKLSGVAPSEFRIFKSGKNTTTKGTFLFDKEAAQLVMAAYHEHGVDLMVDLEHLSLDAEAANFNPDARGWAKLEVRHGELWATNVKWTEEGAKRLADKTQRYISPAFEVDPTTKRVTRVLNMALTALPATDHAQALVAANQTIETKNNARLTMLGDADMKLASDWLAAVQDLAGKAADPALQAFATEVATKLQSLIDGTAQPEAVSEEAPQPEAAAADVRVAAAARKVCNCETPEEVEAALVGLSESHKSIARLTEEVARLRGSEEKRELEAIVASNRGKITPALKAWALSQTPKALLAFLEHAPVVLSEEKHEPPVTSAGPSNVIALTDEERSVCEQLGQDLGKVLAFKKSRIAPKGV